MIKIKSLWAFLSLTIIGEEVLENMLEKEIIALGAKGYTVSKVTGRSQSAVRDNPWDGENIRIEIITSEETCLKIIQHLKEKYLERYAMITFFHPVTVLRMQHFINCISDELELWMRAFAKSIHRLLLQN